MISKVEPNTGDKRPREDDHHERIASPASRQADANNTQASPQMQGGSQISNQMGNGNFMQMGQHMGGMQLMNNGASDIPGYDALYIGDLQWVRLSCRLALCHYELSHICSLFLFICTVDD